MSHGIFHKCKPVTPAEFNIINQFFEGKEIEDIPLNNESTILFGQIFEFIGYNGKGAFGIVVKAVEKQTSEMCAIKVSRSPDPKEK